MTEMTEREEHALKTAIEVFHRSCIKLQRHRYPNIFMEGNNELLSEWFLDSLSDLEPLSLGKNDHPDYVIHNVGFELKSLKTKGQIQFNSTIPCGGFKHGDLEGECYYVVARYTTERNYGYLADYSVVDGDYFNHDRNWAFSHMNSQESGFGTYGDGVVRYRKMYQFPSPHKSIEGISFISKFPFVHEINSNLVPNNYVDRVDVNGQPYRFYVYRHAFL
ncbi:hypothetical protein [Bacillus cereus]|uniref:hypothetical protein n=1 Tax=Bacillus cereus TaxID=1396 RepID=UPI0030131A2E